MSEEHASGAALELTNWHAAHSGELEGLRDLLVQSMVEIRELRSRISDEMHGLASAIDELIDVKNEVASLTSNIQGFADGMATEVANVADALQADLSEHVSVLSVDGAAQAAGAFNEIVSREAEHLRDALHTKLDDTLSQALSHPKRIIEQTCEHIAGEFDKSAEEMTKELSTFRPVLKELEAALHPALDSLNHVMGIARSVGM